MRDLVSIVSTLYNYREYIRDLIESVLKQTYSNWELIIVDDGSTDRPREVINPYLDQDKRISYIGFDKNRGYSFAKNEGIVRTKGSFIVMIDADDMLTPSSIECRCNALQVAPDRLWCHGEVLVKKGDILSEESYRYKKTLRARLSREMDLTKEYHHRLVHAQSVMVRPEFHKRLGLYDEELRFSSDNEMWRRAIRFGIIPIHCNEKVAIYRRHGRQMCRSLYKKERIRAMKKVILDKVERRFREGINERNTRLWL